MVEYDKKELEWCFLNEKICKMQKTIFKSTKDY